MGSYASGVWSYSNPHFESHSFAISVDGKAHGVTLDSTGTHGTVTLENSLPSELPLSRRLLDLPAED
mgnify:CR=1 FL=1